MANLIALSPCAGMLPVTVGEIEMTEIHVDRIVSVAPFAGKSKAVSDALKSQLGNGLPATGRRNGPVMWFGHGTWMVADVVALDGLAAVTDQSDAWAAVQMAGSGVEDVLARLVPVDLRPSVFKKNHVAKTMLGHMSATITRIAPDTFEIMVMRSMAGTLVHDLRVAMHGVAAR